MNQFFKLAVIADVLKIEKGSKDWYKLIDYAKIDAGNIPEYVLKQKEIKHFLPQLFNMLAGKKRTGYFGLKKIRNSLFAFLSFPEIIPGADLKGFILKASVSAAVLMLILALALNYFNSGGNDHLKK